MKLQADLGAVYTIQPGNWSGLYCTSHGLWRVQCNQNLYQLMLTNLTAWGVHWEHLDQRMNAGTLKHSSHRCRGR